MTNTATSVPPVSRSSGDDPDRDQVNILTLISGTGTNLQALIDATNSTSNSTSTSTSSLPNCRISHVLSNRLHAYGLTRARDASIPTTYHNLVPYKKRQEQQREQQQQQQQEQQQQQQVQSSQGQGGHAADSSPTEIDPMRLARREYDADLAAMITRGIEPRPDMVVCAGWMHIFGSVFVDAMADAGVPVINLHPALPGRFNGANAIRRAYEAGQRGEIDRTGVMVHYVISEVDMGEPVVVREVGMVKGESLEELEERIHKVEWDIIVEGTRIVAEKIRKERRGTYGGKR